MTDQGFPIITYRADESPRARGLAHGEAFRNGIRELIQIRSELLHEKNPTLNYEQIEWLAQIQWRATRDYDAALAEEFDGIRIGADVSIRDLVILNNYTDFRDIHLPDEGCSVVFVNQGQPIAGQTWDMHGSAKNYVCILAIESPAGSMDQLYFSIVGCVGMMGFDASGQMVGVNNINTDSARPAAMWPAVIRRVLDQPSHDQMVNELTTAPVTSGHTYLIASTEFAEFWEVLPGLNERVSELPKDERGFLIHTNHCLGEQAAARETKVAVNSTTYIRYELLEKKIGATTTFDDVYELLNDHENYPKSICSNFQTDSQDPSITCGGAVGDLSSGRIRFWRGDELYDENFVAHEFQLGERVVG